jgi:hypothetical protein
MTRRNKILPDDFSPSDAIRQRFVQHVADGKLACSEAFRLSGELGLPESEIGNYADLCGVRLVKCQIGLFGYGPEKKRLVETRDLLDPDLASAVRSLSNGGVILCVEVFGLAESFKISKVDVGCACETLGIRVKGCRFGAF